MPLGKGYFLNRRTGRLHLVEEHASDVIKRPKRYGLTEENIQDTIGTTAVDAGYGLTEEERGLIIRLVTANGFIRIRYHKDRLGYQFTGDPHDALDRLRRLMSRWGVGSYTLITFTDFSINRGVSNLAKYFTKGNETRAIAALLEHWDSTRKLEVNRYDR